jgi:hypothetical protein
MVRGYFEFINCLAPPNAKQASLAKFGRALVSLRRFARQTAGKSNGVAKFRLQMTHALGKLKGAAGLWKLLTFGVPRIQE